MFEWSLLNFVWLIVAALCAGFGWVAGAWIFEKSSKERHK